MPGLFFPTYPTGGPTPLHDASGAPSADVAMVFHITTSFGQGQGAGRVKGEFVKPSAGRNYFAAPPSTAGVATYTPSTPLAVIADEDANADGVTSTAEEASDQVQMDWGKSAY